MAATRRVSRRARPTFNAASLLAADGPTRLDSPSGLLLPSPSVAGSWSAGLALLVRTNDALLNIDSSAASWSHAHATGWSTRALDLVTMLGDGASHRRSRDSRLDRRMVPRAQFARRPVPGGGDRRKRSDHDGRQESGRPRATCAQSDHRDSWPLVPERPLVGGCRFLRGRCPHSCPPTRTQQHSERSLAAPRLSPSLSPAAACSSSVHWFSDVIAGLALGWGWVACCVILIGVGTRVPTQRLLPRTKSVRLPRRGRLGDELAARHQPRLRPRRRCSAS